MGKNFYLAGKISESGSLQKLEGVSVKIYNKATNELVSSTFTDKNGKYYSDTLETGANNDPINYKVVFEKEGYLNVNYEIPIVVGQSHIVYLDTLINSQLLAATPGNNIGVSLKPIYFNYNDYRIRKDAAIELDKVVTLLKNNPAITIELGAHTDARGDDVNNQILSEKRAKASADYIISKGIDASRITAVGYGESKLLVSNEKVDRIKRYRDKEVAHQKNRRTEFIITNNRK
jgi:outer membrane protein OmpA-like peptidoglycan-associated protein